MISPPRLVLKGQHIYVTFVVYITIWYTSMYIYHLNQCEIGKMFHEPKTSEMCCGSFYRKKYVQRSCMNAIKSSVVVKQ